MNALKHIYFLSLLASVAIAAGCTDDFANDFIPDGETSDVISFKVSDWNGGSAARSRSAADEAPVRGGGVITMTNEETGDTLYLHTLISDSWPEDTDTPTSRTAIDNITGTVAEQPVTTEKNLYDKIGVVACYHDGDWTNDIKHRWDYMYNALYTKNAGYYETNPKYYWPTTGNMTFIAYAPYDDNVNNDEANSAGVYVNQNPYTGNFYFWFQMKSNGSIDGQTRYPSWNQYDIIYSTNLANIPCKEQSINELKFQHAMTAVKFKTADDMLEGNISQIKIWNVATHGKFIITPGGKGEWTNVDNYGCAYRGQGYVSNGAQDLNNGNHYLFMVPQEFTGKDDKGSAIEQQIVVEFQEKLSEKSFTLKGNLVSKEGEPVHTWEPGQTVTYILSSSSVLLEPYLEVIDGDGNPLISIDPTKTKEENTITNEIECDFGVASKSIQVKSYLVNSKKSENSDDIVKVEKALYWRALPTDYVGVDDKGVTNNYKWLSYDENGSDNPITYLWGNGHNTTDITKPDYQSRKFAILDDGSYDDNHPHTDIIAENTYPKHPNGTTKDLSGGTNHNPQNTANCYIINAGGDYELPLVYGNAIKNGAAYYDSFVMNSTTATSLNTLYASGFNTNKENIKKTITEVTAETTKASGSSSDKYTLNVFKNHLDKRIVSPWIHENEGFTVTGCELVWQDSEGLITNIKLDQTNHYLSFTAAPKEGNAIIAVTEGTGSNKKIVWSWHIWVTDYDGTFSTGYDQTKYDYEKKIGDITTSEKTFMGVNLGWCGANTRTYKARDLVLTFEQSTTKDGKALIYTDKNGDQIYPTLTIKQIGGEVQADGNSPYYQFGRKDPMRASSGTRYTSGLLKEKNLYDKDGLNNGLWQSQEVKEHRITIGEAIQTPNIFYDNPGSEDQSWCATPYYNHWSAQCDGPDKVDNVVKTIYDPSPAGYRVPGKNDFKFTTSGGSAVTETFTGGNGESWFSESNKILVYIYNTSVDEIHKALGWTFFSNQTQSGNVIHFPALGVRSYDDGKIAYASNSRGYYWTAVPQFDPIDTGEIKPDKYGSSFGFFSNGFEFNEDNSGDQDELGIYPTNTNSRAGGLSIRPVRE